MGNTSSLLINGNNFLKKSNFSLESDNDQETKTFKKFCLNFQDMQQLLKYYQQHAQIPTTSPNSHEVGLLINPLPIDEQKCILPYTMSPEKETEYINTLIAEKKTDVSKIIVYGKHCNDFSVLKKQAQLQSLGFTNVFVYLGGMFEWLLLQDFFSTALFPTTTIEKDLLVFMPASQFSKSSPF